jgi:hypothetical protein
MMPEKLPNIVRGRMTSEEKAEIERLAETLKRPMPGPIARRLNRHPATVKWYMLRHGLLVQPRRCIPGPYTTKSGITRHPWTPPQDARLEELLAAGKNYRQAGEILTAEFNIPRNTHNCQVRAVMLAASEH